MESRLGDEIEFIHQELDRTKLETTRVRNLLETSQATMADARDEISKLRSTVSRLERDNRDLVSENQTLLERATKESSKSEEMITEIHRLTSNEKSLSERLSAMQLEIQTLTREKQTVLRDRHLLQTRLEQVRSFVLIAISLVFNFLNGIF